MPTMTTYNNELDRKKIITDVESSTNKTETLRIYGLHRATYYRWLKHYQQHGTRGLKNKSTKPKASPNAIPSAVRRKLYKYAKQDRFKSGKEVWLKLQQQGEKISYQTALKLLQNHQPPLHGRVTGWKSISENQRVMHRKIGLANNGYTAIAEGEAP